MTEHEQIKTIRNEIFEQARRSENLEVMHWCMWLDDCFENDEFHDSEAENVRWRMMVLKDKGELVNVFNIQGGY